MLLISFIASTSLLILKCLQVLSHALLTILWIRKMRPGAENLSQRHMAMKCSSGLENAQFFIASLDCLSGKFREDLGILNRAMITEDKERWNIPETEFLKEKDEARIEPWKYGYFR